MIRTYSEMRKFEIFEERLKYLSLKGKVGRSTFGFDRYINQKFYTSRQWAMIRSHVIIRDNGCDLGVAGYEIGARLLIHHMNPMTVEDVSVGNDHILDPEFLITTTHRTHNAIHFGDDRLKPKLPKDRGPGDTKLW